MEILVLLMATLFKILIGDDFFKVEMLIFIKDQVTFDALGDFLLSRAFSLLSKD